MANVNPMQDVVEDILKDFRKLRRDAKASKVVPFGQERVTRQELGKRLREGTPEQRKKLREAVGLDEAMKALGE